MATTTLRTRITSFFRRPSVRLAATFAVGYQVYHTANNYVTMYKPFSAHRHRLGETILDLNLDNLSLVHHDSFRPFSSAEEMRLHRLIAALRVARDDPRVAGLVVRGLTGLSNMGLADLTELRDAIQRFSQGWGGKHTMLHIPAGLGGAGNGTVPLYFASVFDSVHTPPSAPVIIPGLSLATLFFKRLLDNLGLRAVAVARKDFKTAANSLTEDKFTDAHRESTESLLDAIMTHMVDSIASGRRISSQAVRDAIDDAILTAQEAHAAGLVDAPLHRDELPAEMRARLAAASEVRAQNRAQAEADWKDAMRNLRDIWNSDESAIDLWANGAVNANLGDFEFAFPMSITLTDSHQDAMRKSTKAEIRALKAHLAWLDTCPWEQHELDSINPSDDVYRSVSYTASLLNVERKLCEHAIRTLEEFPTVIDSYRKPEEGVLELDFKDVGRWVRSVWKAKCMAARMVGTMEDIEFQARKKLHSIKGKATDEALQNEVDRVTFQPRSFLVEMVENVDIKLPTDKEDQKELVASSSAEMATDESEDKEEDASDTENPKSKKKLQYMRMSDYVDLVNNEHRAYAERGNLPIRYEVKSPYPHTSGLVDGQDKNMLLQLQSPDTRLAPWRFNVPKGNIVAVIHIDDMINDDDADMLRTAIRRADKDPNVKAMVLRIESPGGSAVASDIISRAVEVAKKPVVASMGSVCASGGYLIAAPCDVVFASPMTITGSIGVVMQTFNSAKLFERVGITSDSVDSGKFAKYFGVLGLVTDWSEEYAKRIDNFIDGVYADFVKVVAKGRKMGAEEVEAVAQGRVWAGSDALRLGLVDRFGGLQEAINAAAEMAKLAPDSEVRAVEFPTVAMQVQDAARRRGLIPANLDEEGDEVGAERRKRRWLWGSNKEDTEEPPSGNDEIALEGMGSGEQESPGVQGSLGAVILNRVLCSLDRFLLTLSAPSWSSSLLESILGEAYGLLNSRSQKAVMDELKAVRATNGRPAALAPSIVVDDGSS